MFRLKFLSLTQSQKQKKAFRSSVACDGRDELSVPPKNNKYFSRRTYSNDIKLVIPITEHIKSVDTSESGSYDATEYVPVHEAKVPTMVPGYPKPVESIRQEEYPHMNNGVYLDHSGATIYARSTVEAFTAKMVSGLYGNPHSANAPAKLSGEVVDSVRAKTLHFFGADPKHYDLIFVANATAGIKLVADSFRDLAEKTRTGSFWYGYHKEAHTSLVGVREFSDGDHHCFETDDDVATWLEDPSWRHVNRRNVTGLGLLAYPGQSNLNGRRMPLSWVRRLRQSQALQNTYSLFDAAALAMTSPLEYIFEDPSSAPDFTCVSLYKVFGFPDLGALIVRKDSGHILALRRYFGGGTVTMVSALGGSWHKSKALESSSAGDGHGYALHDGLEDGTLPFHSILALGEAIDVHKRLYGSMANVSRHTTHLVRVMYEGMRSLRHPNGQPLCHVYSDDEAFGNPLRQGATIAFNIFRQDGTYVPYSDVESMANERKIYIRSGGICCPGGLFTALRYEPWELDRARSAGHHCGSDGLSLINQLPTGVVRASLGAMSTMREVDTFIGFLHEVFVEKDICVQSSVSLVAAALPIHQTACHTGGLQAQQSQAGMDVRLGMGV